MAQKMKKQNEISGTVSAAFAAQARELIMNVIKDQDVPPEWFDIQADEQAGMASICAMGQKITIAPKKEGAGFRVTHEQGVLKSIDSDSSQRGVQMLVKNMVKETQCCYAPDFLR